MVKFCLFSLLLLTVATTSFAQNLSSSTNLVAKETKPNKSLSDGKVAFVDTRTFNAEIGEIKKQYEKVQLEFQKQIDELKALDQQVKKLEDELNSNSLSEKAQKEKATQYQSSKKELETKYDYYDKALQNKLEMYLSPIKEKIFKALELYAQEHNIIAVFSLSEANSLIFYENTNNITEDFIKEYNKQNPVTK